MRIASSLLVDLNLERPSVIDQLRAQLVEVRAIEGRVVEALGAGRYRAMLGGRSLVFMPSRPLEVGASFTARLVGGQLVMDFPEAAGPAQAAEAATGRVMVRTLPEVLAELGLPAEPRYVAAVQALLRAGVSLTPEAVQAFHSNLAPEGVQDPLLLAFLIQRAIPVDASLLATLEAVFRQRRALGEALPRLLAEGEGLLGRLTEGQGAAVLAGILEGLRRQLGRVRLGGPMESWLEELRRAVAASGVFRESRWALALAQGEEGLPLEDLKSLLLELQSWSARLAADTPEQAREAAGLERLAGAAVGSIEAAQLASARAPWDSRAMWFLQIPLWVEGRLESFQMVIEGESPGRGEPLSSPVQVDLYLELSELGPLRARLTLLEGAVDGQIVSAREEIVGMLEAALPQWLEGRRREAGQDFPFRRLGARQAEHPEELAPPTLLEPRWEAGAGGTLGRVDLKA